MAIEIIKFDKSLSLIDAETILVSEALTIDHFNDVIESGCGEIGFVIYSTNCQIPNIGVEYSVVIREKVDMSARGPNDTVIKEQGHDNYPLTNLPVGFKELKGK
jgi:hypothetical protein